MPVSNRTSDFREIVNEKQKEFPESKRPKTSKQPHAQRDGRALLGKEYVAEAYIIVREK
jgi:hypothetical protein